MPSVFAWPARRPGPAFGIRAYLALALSPMLAALAYLLWRWLDGHGRGVPSPQPGELAVLVVLALVTPTLLWRHGRRLRRAFDALGATVAGDGPDTPPAIRHPGELRELAGQIGSALQAARQVEADLQLVATEAADCLFRVGDDGRHHFLTTACARVYGHSQAELQADPDLFWHCLHPEDRPAYRALLQGPPQAAAAAGEFRIILPDGTHRWLAHHGQARYAADGAWLGWHGRHTDITARKAAGAARQRAEDLADALFAITPALILELDREGGIVRFNRHLEAATGYAADEVRGRDWFGLFLPERRRRASHALFRHVLDHPVRREYVDVIVTRGGEERVIEWQDIPLHGETGAVTGLLAAGRPIGGPPALPDMAPPPASLLAASAGSPEWAACRCEEVLANVLCMITPAAALRGLRVYTDCDRLPPHLLGAPGRLAHALLNYANNAVRHTERGSIALRVRLLEETDTGVLVRFEVEDSGSGIDPGLLPGLFDALANHPDGHPAPRLGLALTRHLARQMGGDAGAASIPGRGSTFWFTARLWKDASRPAADMPAAGPAMRALGREHTGCLVLVAGRDSAERRHLRVLLEGAGLLVDVAGSGAEAVRLADATSYALVLSEANLDDMPGGEAARRIRRLAGYAGVPIVALTTGPDGEAPPAGFDASLAAPADPREIGATLLRLLAPGAPTPAEPA
jgi:PAS domain S-box-containing protein